MTNRIVRDELLDIFEEITDKINDVTYLRALNLLARIRVDEVATNYDYPTDESYLETMTQLMNRLDGISEPLGNRVIGENFMVTDPLILTSNDSELIFPLLNIEERLFLTQKFITNSRWRFMINNTSIYIFNHETMRFVMRSSMRGKSIIKRCYLQQFPHIYTINHRTGRLVFRLL